MWHSYTNADCTLHVLARVIHALYTYVYMWHAIIYSLGHSTVDNETVRIDEQTLLLSLHQHNTTNNTYSHSEPTWFLDHIGTIVASLVALLLLSVVIVLIGCITGHWRWVKPFRHGNCIIFTTCHNVIFIAYFTVFCPFSNFLWH